MSGHLHVHDTDQIRMITIDRPEVKNALTRAMRDELCEVLTDTDADDAVSVVVLTAVDPVFSAGVDFKEVANATRLLPPPTAPATNPAAVLREMRTPAICAVNGACVSGALEIALSATFIIASERARFADTHARLGVVAAWGLTALLPRAVGVRKAAEMSITGNFVESEEALRIGLVNHVVPHSDLLPASIASGPRRRCDRTRSPRSSTSTDGAMASPSTKRYGWKRRTSRTARSMQRRSVRRGALPRRERADRLRRRRLLRDPGSGVVPGFGLVRARLLVPATSRSRSARGRTRGWRCRG